VGSTGKLVAGQDQRRREVGERRREQQQERIREAGHASGSVTVRNTRQRDAPSENAMPSMFESIAARIGRSVRYAIGK
jgi:hypothetical protein